MSIPTVTVDATGIHLPEYAEILAYVQEGLRTIYGDDLYLEPDSQDGQMAALFALAAKDLSSAALAAANSFSPATAQGVGLSRVVKINGLKRALPSFSSLDLRCVGQAGTIITDGIARDDSGNRWILPSEVVIPVTGETTVTAVAERVGAIRALPHTVNNIATPTRGWQSVDNPNSASPGNPVESDFQLKNRQQISTSIPSTTVLEGLIGAIAEISGVTRIKAYENDTDIFNDDGLPPHSISIVVEGGDALEIAQVIKVKKGPGVGTFGGTIETIVDSLGIPHDIGFFRPIIVGIQVVVTLRALEGFTQDIQTAAGAAVTNWINALKIGQDVSVNRLRVPASLNANETFELVNVEISRDDQPVGAENISIAFNEAATTSGVEFSFRL
jgi:uncharacterized phage protein gp47/JayE